MQTLSTELQVAPEVEPALSASGPAGPDVLREELIAYLQRRNNPFDDFVAASGVSGRRRSTHVASVNHDVAETLRKAMSQYCFDWQEIVCGQEVDILWSGVIVVLGKRGEGKTHLLHHELSTANAVVVAPTELQTYRPFREYLLVELIERLQRDPPHASPMVELAQWFTRKLLVHALSGLTEMDWICLCRSENERPGWWWPLSSQMARQLQFERTRLLESLAAETTDPIREICTAHEQSCGFMQQLALTHLRETQLQRTAAQQLRCRLFCELVELAFDPERTEIFDVLLSGSRESLAEGASPVSRGTLVDERLSCLVELFLMLGRPIVFAFDGLELLLEDPPDKRCCQIFHNGIAQVIDLLPGIPFFLFAEEGHWQRASQHFSSYADQRFQRGVPIPGRGAVNRLDLRPIDEAGLRQIVAARLRPLFKQSPLADQLNGTSDILPFHDDDIGGILRHQLAGSESETPPLRIVLQRLQGRYDEIVFNRRPAQPEAKLQAGSQPESSPPATSETANAELSAIWDPHVRKAERAAERDPLISLVDRVHQGAQLWLECWQANGGVLDGWGLTDVDIKTFGDDLRYGSCIRCHWQQGDRIHRQGLAFLMGVRRSMPLDLRMKLGMMRSASRVVDSLILLWPRADAIEPAHEALPSATAKVWHEFAETKHATRVRLRAIETSEIAPWLALSDFRRSAVDDQGVADHIFQHFVVDALASRLTDVAPFSIEDSQS